MYELIIYSVILLLVIATGCDLKWREIPDWISLLILGMAIIAVSVGQHPRGWSGVTIGFSLATLLSVVAFALGVWGGGDVKLLAAIGALLGPMGWLTMMFWVAITGGALAIVAAVRGQQHYAYVPAIAAGYAIVVLCPTAMFFLV